MRKTTILKGAALALAAAGIASAVTRAARGMRLAGRTALVCGASRGLGRAVARELARRGCRVAITARSEDDLEDAREELEAMGATVYAEPCDLRRTDDTERLVANVAARLGPIDVLVANAATLTVGPIETLTRVDFEEQMESTFFTSLNAALAVLPSMRARRTGTVAFITSIGGKLGVPHLAPYSAAKFAAVGLSEALAAEVARDGVHVLTVVPGLMRTGSHLRARFRGAAEEEFTWFGASAVAPGISIDADAAARRIASGIERGAAQVVYTLPARLAARTHDLVPWLYRGVMEIAGRLLPGAPAEVREEEGRVVALESDSKAVQAIRRRSREPAQRHGQL